MGKGATKKPTINSPEECRRLVESIEFLIVSIANDYCDVKGCRYLFDDLLQVGHIAAMRAAELFDASKGFAFTTYAYDCIKGSMQRAHDQEKKHKHNDIYNKEGEFIDVAAPEIEPTDTSAIKKLLKRLTERQRKVIHARFWEDKTLQQIADEMGMSRQGIEQIEKAALKRMGE